MTLSPRSSANEPSSVKPLDPTIGQATVKLWDCHTHSSEPAPEAIRSYSYDDWSELTASPSPIQLASIGLHPWHLPECASPSAVITQMEQLFARQPRIVALGECGIDKLRSNASRSEQLTWLESQMRLACQLRRPIVLHVVRAWSEMIAMREQMARSFDQLPPMVLHAFRAGQGVAQMMLRAGFALSFGHYYNIESLRLAHEAGRLLVETDEVPCGITYREAIEENYRQLASALALAPESLAHQVAETPFWVEVHRQRPASS